MLYAEQHWTKSIDLKSAVERLYEQLDALEFDADRETLYEITFLKGKTCSQGLVKRLRKVGLQHCLDTINDYIRNCSDSDSSSSFDEEESKAVEQNGEDSETTGEEYKKSKGERHC
ncbi:hypothetical protein FQA39_LY14328 [Lamprigera yunnana]|nr:hypothetical protein FQA39_LY14328 [Lamprigera yunnana]